jgi:SAM-dependent methyltransferase
MTTASASLLDTARWTAHAIDYDGWFDEPWGRYAFAVESAAVLNAAGALAGKQVLDAGCGTGRFAAALRSAGADLVGIDLAGDMLTIASTRLRRRCARAAIERLPFPDKTFDTAVAITVLEFVADPDAALVELARVTRDGGRIVIGALNPHSPWGWANRERLRNGAWCQAHFLDPNALSRIGARLGRTALQSVLYAPGAFPALPLVGHALEVAGRATPRWGAFQVLTIDKDPRP